MAKNTVRVNVVGDASSYKRAMGDAGQATDTAGKKMTDFAKVAVAALAIKALQAVATFVKGSHDAFVSLNESLNAVEVTFGKSAEGVKKLGKEAATSLGLSNAEFNSFAVGISAFAQQIAGDSGDVVGVVDDLTTRVSDFASVMNLEVKDAARIFQSGLAGESEPLRKFGIDVSAATVKTFAYANGIAEAGEELTEAQKVQARYGTILEQTDKVAGDFTNTIDEFANAQRVANAEAENAKAAIGQGLDAAFKAATPLIAEAAKGLGVIALSIQGLTGSLSPAEVALQQFELQMGVTADTAQAALTIQKEWGVSIEDLLPLLDLSTEELDKLRNADEEFLKSLGLTEEQIQSMSAVLDDELITQLNASRDAARHAGRGQKNLEEATEDTTEAIETQAEVLRAQIDPVFKLINKVNDAAEAQRELNEARKEFGEGSPEVEAALLRNAEAQLGVAEAIEGTNEAGGINTTQLYDMMIQTGATKDEAQRLIDKLQNLDDVVLGDKSFDLHVNLPSIMYTGDPTKGGLIPVRTGTVALARGGIATNQVSATIGEAGSEAVIPLDRRGVEAMSKAVNQYGGGGAGITLNVYAGMGADGSEIGRQVVEAIRSYERQNGAAWRSA